MFFCAKIQKCDFAPLRRLGFDEKQWFSRVPNVSSIGDFYVSEKIIIDFSPRNSPKIGKNHVFLKKVHFLTVLDYFAENPFENKCDKFEKNMCFLETPIFC